MNLKKYIRKSFSPEVWSQRWYESLDFIDLILSSNLPRLVIMLFFVVFFGGSIILIFETAEGGFADLFDSMWWALVSMTTVGYGDLYPTTSGGRILAGFIILCGVAIISLFTATVSSIFVARKIKEEKGLQKIFFQDHYVILGWNVSGMEMLETLLSPEVSGGDAKIVLINDLSPEQIEELLQKYKHHSLEFLKGDYTGTAVLHRAKIEKAKAVLILPDGEASPESADERTVLATLAVKSVSPRIKTYVQVLHRRGESHLRRAGADRVIVPDKMSGYLLASCAIQPSIPRLMEKLLSGHDESSIKVISVPKEFVGKTFEELFLHFKRNENKIVIGFVAGESILATEDILSDDISSVDAFIQQKLLQAGRSPEELETTFINLNPSLDYIIRPIDQPVVIGGN